MTAMDRNEEISITFCWAFAKCSGDVLLEDPVARYTYDGKIKEKSTVFEYAKIMMPTVREAYMKIREEAISEGLDLTCLRGIAGVAGVIASLAFCVDDMRLHFRLNILSLNIFHDSWVEYDQADSEFMEVVGSIQKMLFQHQLVEFMVLIFSCSLSWLDHGEGESNIVVKTLSKLLYGNGTSILVTTKYEEDWSWEPIYNAGEPKVGVVYDIQNNKKKFYQGLVTRLDRKMTDGDELLTLYIHFIGWIKLWDEVWSFNESGHKIFTRGTFTKGPFDTSLWGPKHWCNVENNKYYKQFL